MLSFLKTLLRPFQPRNHQRLEVGAYYAIRYDEHHYKVLKVLAVDDFNGDPYGVHIRLYGRLYHRAPKKLDLNNLDAENRTEPGDGDTTIGAALRQLVSSEMTMGHLPYSFEAFVRMMPRYIQSGEVSEDELDGYRIWEESEGGYWG